MSHRVAIIGGGISGLAAAHHLRRLNPEVDVLLLEAGSRLGGVIQTTSQDGFLVEDAADNFITTSPAAVGLCQELGLGGDLICTSGSNQRSMVVHHGRLEPIPAGFLVMAPSRIWPFVSTRILSPLGKLRACLELFTPRKNTDADESLKSFVTRRFGRQLFERLVQPLVGGIYTADPSRLSVAATMPRFVKMEHEHGSLIRGMLRQRQSDQNKPKQNGGARYSQFMALRGGMSTLVDALANDLPEQSVKLESPVCCIVPGKGQRRGRWTILMKQGTPSNYEVDAVIMAAPANRAWGMLSTVDAHLSDDLREIEYASCAVVSLAYRRQQIGNPLDSFGFVVPLAEKRLILSCSFSSIKYDGRAPDGTVLMRVFIGGACQRDLLNLPDHQLVEIAKSELAKLLKIEGEPVMQHLAHQNEAMPQYHVGHTERIERITGRMQMHPTLAIAGSALGGVGVPACIESGTAAAERIVSALATSRTPPSLVSA